MFNRTGIASCLTAGRPALLACLFLIYFFSAKRHGWLWKVNVEISTFPMLVSIFMQFPKHALRNTCITPNVTHTAHEVFIGSSAKTNLYTHRQLCRVTSPFPTFIRWLLGEGWGATLPRHIKRAADQSTAFAGRRLLPCANNFLEPWLDLKWGSMLCLSHT